MKKGLFCSQEKRRRFARVAKYFLSSFYVFKYSSIQVFRNRIQIVLVVFKEEKKHADSEYHHFITAKSNDISEDLNSVAFHCSSTTKLQGPREEELRQAKQVWVVFVSAALRPTFCWSLIASEPRGRPYILGNRYEHLIR